MEQPVLWRLITDKRFRRLAGDSLEAACRQEGYRLFPAELRLHDRTRLPPLPAFGYLLPQGEGTG